MRKHCLGSILEDVVARILYHELSHIGIANLRFYSSNKNVRITDNYLDKQRCCIGFRIATYRNLLIDISAEAE